MKPAARIFLIVAGAAALAFGVLFALQGAGIVRWPPSSMMVGTRGWIENGIVIALAGIAALVAAWRK